MIEKISIDLIDDFNNHPFKVNDDELLKELADSINENGLLEPLVVRKKKMEDMKCYPITEEKSTSINSSN